MDQTRESRVFILESECSVQGVLVGIAKHLAVNIKARSYFKEPLQPFIGHDCKQFLFPSPHLDMVILSQNIKQRLIFKIAGSKP